MGIASLLLTRELVDFLGEAAGLCATANLGAVSRSFGSRAREVLPSLGNRLLRVLAIGGEGPDGSSKGSCESFCLAEGRWRPVQARLLERRAGCAAVRLDEKVIVVGGDAADFETLFTAEVLGSPSPSCGSTGSCGVFSGRAWVPLSPMPTRRVECAAVAYRGAVIVIGGRDADATTLATVDRYAPGESTENGAWSALPPMRFARAGCAAAVANGQLVVCGGSGDERVPLASTELYQPDDSPAGRGNWRPGPELQCARWRCAAGPIGPNSVCVVAGLGTDNTPQATCEVMDLSCSEPRWESLPPLRCPRWACAVATLPAGRLCVLGGLARLSDSTGDSGTVVNDMDAPLTSVEYLSPDSDSWRPLPSLRMPRGLLAAATVEAPIPSIPLPKVRSIHARRGANVNDFIFAQEPDDADGIDEEFQTTAAEDGDLTSGALQNEESEEEELEGEEEEEVEPERNDP